MDQCHSVDVARADGPWDGAGAAGRRARVHPGRRRPRRARPPTAYPSCSPTRSPASSGRPRRPARAGRAGRRPRASRRCATPAPTPAETLAVVGPSVCGRLLRGAGGDARRGRRREPAERDGVVDRHAGDRRGRRRGGPALGARDPGRAGCPAAPARARTSTRTGATAPPAGSPGIVARLLPEGGARRDGGAPGRDRRRARRRPRPDRDRVRRGRTRPRRQPSPHRGDEVLPGHRPPAARRPRGPATSGRTATRRPGRS